MPTKYVERAGESLLLGAQPIHLRGLCFGNRVWDQDVDPREHHGEADFARVRAWGANVVRFYLHHSVLDGSGRWFATPEDGLEWLDENLRWASKHGVLVIPSLYVPPGSSAGPDGVARLWSDEAEQDRIVALWAEVAWRYRDEPIIAGYDLLHHPQPPANAPEAWKSLAQRIAAAVREVDHRHLLVVQGIMKLTPSAGTLVQTEELFTIEDPNALTEFHFFDPLEFTHQGAPWFPSLPRESRYGAGDPASSRLDRAFLIRRLEELAGWGRAAGVPLYCGELGLLRQCFEPGRGGLAWIGDVLATLHRLGIHYTYHAYREEWFGLLRDQGGPPDPRRCNAALVECLKEWLGRP